MPKAMVFIDGTWLYSNTHKLAEACGKPDFRLHFGKLPYVLTEEVRRQIGCVDLDVVRTHLFGSYPANFDLADEDLVQTRLDFFAMLKEEYHYEVELFPINFRGRRVRRKDRAAGDTFEPQEKCVDISLATCMLYYAAIPSSYDIAIAVLGDQDFKPLLQHTRRLGKRVAIASVRESCSPDYSDPRDEARVKDFDIIWLNDLLPELELRYEPHELECQSPFHAGDKRVVTTFYPRKGQRFYCESCQAEFARQKGEAQRRYFNSDGETPLNGDNFQEGEIGKLMAGRIKVKHADRGFGFIEGDNGQDYFFHLTDLEDGLDFADVIDGLAVGFEVKKLPLGTKAGAATNVHLAM
jgi:cold shock CspA family protein